MTVIRSFRIIVLNAIPGAKDPDATSDEPAHKKDHEKYNNNRDTTQPDGRTHEHFRMIVLFFDLRSDDDGQDRLNHC